MSPHRHLPVVLALIALPASATANMANPLRPGDVAGEPSGDVSRLSVEREELIFDLRGLADGRHGRIEARYQIRNPHDEMSLELQFVAANLDADAGEIAVELDGRAIDARVDADAPTPERWTLGESATHIMHLADPEQAERTTSASIFFELELSPGSHEISVSYPVTAWTNGHMPKGEGLTPGLRRHETYLVPYVLAPAREWGSFGELHVEVRLPDRWDVATYPALEDAGGDVASGSFDGIPATGFYVEARPQFIHSWRSVPGIVAGLAVLLALVLLLPLWLGRRPRGPLARWSDDDGTHGRLTTAICAVLVATIGLLAVPIGFVVHELVAPSTHVYIGWSYAMLWMSLFGAPVASLVSLIVFALSRLLSARGTSRAA